MITKVINVNLHQPIYERLTAKQGDIASRYLLFHLLDGDKPLDLTDKSVRVYAIKPDKTEIFNDLVINDKTKGYCTLELTSQCLAEAGIVKMELYISQSGKVLTSIPFELEVIKCINTANSIVSTNEFSALEVALGSLQDYYNLRSEIVQARKGHATVGGRLDNIDSQLDNIKHFDYLQGELYSSDRLQLFIKTHSYIIIKKADYILDKVVKIPSNRTIVIEEGATFTLKEGCNEYIFENEDLVNGNENISISGGIYYGKGDTMTRKFNGATLEEDYYGFGLHFYMVKNLRLNHMRIYETNAWAIAHNLCDDVVIDDIFVWQKVGGINGDGVTGQSKNVRISNIRGFSNDDLVAFGGWGAQMGANEMKIPKQDIENYHIENVEGILRDGNYPLKGVAIYQRNERRVNNVVVKNIKGFFEYGAVFFRGLNEYDYYFSNINIENVNAITKRAVGTIQVDMGNILNINVTNTTQKLTNNHAYFVCGLNGYSTIKTLTMSNINIHTDNNIDMGGGCIIYDKGDIEDITMSNCSRTSINNFTTLYLRDSIAKCSKIPNIKINGCKFTSISEYNPIEIKPTSLKISLCTTDFHVREEWLTPKEKDIIYSETKGLTSFSNGMWKSQRHCNLISVALVAPFTVSQTAFTKIMFDRVAFSNNLSLDDGSIEILEDGYYTINASVGSCEGAKSACRITQAIFKNDVEDVWLSQRSVNVGDYVTANGTVTLRLVAGDIIDLRVAVSSANEADRKFDNDGRKTYLQIVKL